MQLRWMFVVAAIGVVLTCALPSAAHAEKLAGRLITFKKTFDGWWDVACDTDPDGADARCYVQYVDPYRVKPKFRAAMVDFLYRRKADGAAEPVITFDVEPDLSFARDVRLTVIAGDGAEKEISVAACPSGKCVFAGGTAQAMLIRWSSARTAAVAHPRTLRRDRGARVAAWQYARDRADHWRAAKGARAAVTFVHELHR